MDLHNNHLAERDQLLEQYKKLRASLTEDDPAKPKGWQIRHQIDLLKKLLTDLNKQRKEVETREKAERLHNIPIYNELKKVCKELKRHKLQVSPYGSDL